MEEEEDRAWLSSLGVTSANPEDIERDILAKVSLIFSFPFFPVSNCLGNFQFPHSFFGSGSALWSVA